MTTQMLSPKQHFQSAVKRTIFALRLSKQQDPPSQPQQRQSIVELQHMIARSPSIMSGGIGARSCEFTLAHLCIFFHHFVSYNVSVHVNVCVSSVTHPF